MFLIETSAAASAEIETRLKYDFDHGYDEEEENKITTKHNISINETKLK